MWFPSQMAGLAAQVMDPGGTAPLALDRGSRVRTARADVRMDASGAGAKMLVVPKGNLSQQAAKEQELCSIRTLHGRRLSSVWRKLVLPATVSRSPLDR